MAASSQVRPVNVKIGDYIKFRVISLKDTSIYTGKVVGICGYETARMYDSDVASLHLLMQQGFIQNAVASANGRVMLDVQNQTFLIVKCMDGVTRPFAFEWLMSTLEAYDYVELITKGLVYNIRLYDVTTQEAAQAAELLRSNGYTLKMIETEE